MNYSIKTLQGAASDYIAQYRPLLKWINDDLWANPTKPDQQSDKQRMVALLSMLNRMANGSVQILNKDDFRDVTDLFNSAAYDAERDRVVLFSALPSGKNINAFIGEARDHLIDDLVNGQFVAPNQTVALEMAKKDVLSKVRAFNSQHARIFSDLADYGKRNSMRSLSEIYMMPLKRVLEALIASKPSPFTENMELALLEGHVMFRATAAAIDKASGSSPPLNLLSDLERAAKDYELNVAPVVAHLRHGFNGIAKHFSTSSAGKKT